MMSGLVQRRRNNVNSEGGFDSYGPTDPSPTSPTDASSSAKLSTASNKEEDIDDDDKKSSSRLTLMEEILLLGYKDSEGRLSFWNDNISYVLRGAILIELSFRGRISSVKEPRKRPFAERLVEVVDERITGEVLLDEALRYMKTEVDSISNWIDLLSGETWNIAKIGYQLKQVRERIAKGLVDKGVLRTDKLNFLVFDLPTHPLSDAKVKEDIIQKVVNCLLGRGGSPDKRTIALVCCAYAANVLENALVGLSHSQREAAFQKVDEILQEQAAFPEKLKSSGTTEISAGVMNVLSKMDSIL